MLQTKLNELSTLCSRLKVHKRTASNIRDQFQILDDSDVGRQKDAQLEIILSTLCRNFQALFSSQAAVKKPFTLLQLVFDGFRFGLRAPENVELTSLDWYLAQGSTMEAIDSAHDNIWDTVMLSLDSVLRDQIKSQRETFGADRKADDIDLRYLLRSCLRDDMTLAELKRKRPSEVRTFVDAVQFQMQFSDFGDNTQIYKDWLGRWNSLQLNEHSFVRKIPDLTGKVTAKSMGPVGSGSFTDIWKGEVYGKAVAIHEERGIVGKPDVLKLSQEWANIDHPHVLPLIGICRDFRYKGNTALLSHWMEKGDIMPYLILNPAVDRLKLITQLVSGLEYLHTRDPPVVHGNLTKDNIFINSHDEAVIGGLAWKCFWGEMMSSDSERTVLPYGDFDIVSNSSRDFLPTPQRDIYTLGMIMYQIMTDEAPFRGERRVTVLLALHRGERPARPQGLAWHRGLNDDVWNVMQRCWAAQPAARPSASEILDELKRIQQLPSMNVQDLTDEVILDDELHVVLARGGFGEIRRGRLRSKQVIALKSICYRSKMQPVLRQTKRFRREVTIWNQLRHPNVLPFLGIAEVSGLATALVSPWMENGNCIDYLKAHPHFPRLPIILGIAQGLVYLHSHDPSVVHGDLRGANVLVSSKGEPLLTDFGLAVIIEDLSNMPISSALDGSGNPRWMAPELLVGSDIVSKESDVWAFGMVVLEIMTLEMPFYELRSYPQVILALHNESRPLRPGFEASACGLSDLMWALCNQCWSQQPSNRPDVTVVLQKVEAIVTGSYV